MSIYSENKAIWAVIFVMGLEAFIAFSNGGYFLEPMTLFAGGAWVIIILLLYGTPDDAFSLFSYIELTPMIILFLLFVWTGISVIW